MIPEDIPLGKPFIRANRLYFNILGLDRPFGISVAFSKPHLKTKRPEGRDGKDEDMGAHALAIPVTEERRSRRISLKGEFVYEYDQTESGTAHWCSIGREGACISIGRYLSPGREMSIRFCGVDLAARVVWCRPSTDGTHFVAGLQVKNSGPEASLLALTAMVQKLVA